MNFKYIRLSTLLLSLFLVKSKSDKVQLDVDSNGYIVYCPCMGKIIKSSFGIDFTLIIFIKINRSLWEPS